MDDDRAQGNSLAEEDASSAAVVGDYYPPPPFYFSHFESPDYYQPPRLDRLNLEGRSVSAVKQPPPSSSFSSSLSNADRVDRKGDGHMDTSSNIGDMMGTGSNILSTIFPYINNQLNDIATRTTSIGKDNGSIRQDLSWIVDEILKTSLTMVSTFPPPPNSNSVDEMYMKLHSLTTEFHEKLAGYREQEATALLRIELRRQLIEAKAVREKMKELIVKHGGDL